MESVPAPVDETEDNGEVIDRVDHVPVQRRSSVTAVQSQSPESVVEPSVPPKRRVGRPRKDRHYSKSTSHPSILSPRE